MCSHFGLSVDVEVTDSRWTSVPFVFEREHREQSAFQFEIYRGRPHFQPVRIYPDWGFDVSTHAQPRVCVLGPSS